MVAHRSSPSLLGEGDRAQHGGGAGAKRRFCPLASLAPLHRLLAGPPALQMQGRNS
jgi:hypothetical protein